MPHVRQNPHPGDDFLRRIECLFTLFPAAIAIIFAFIGSTFLCILGLVYGTLFAFLKWPESRAKHAVCREDAQTIDAEMPLQPGPTPANPREIAARKHFPSQSHIRANRSDCRHLQSHNARFSHPAKIRSSLRRF
jgi:hypothetical protein